MTTDVILPELGENIERAEVSNVMVAEGDTIRRDQPLIEVETEKASLEIPASSDGTVKELRVARGDTIKVGQVILVLEIAEATVGVGPAQAPEIPKAVEAAKPAPKPTAHLLEFPKAAELRAPTLAIPVPAAPSVRALARELGVEIGQVPGSGRGGRISRDDVKAHAKQLLRGMRASGGVAPGGATLPDFSRWGEVRREALSRVRRSTAVNLSHAWNSVPHVTQFDAADITSLEELRRAFNERPEAAGIKLTVTAVAVKFAAAALRHFPGFNASLDLAAGELVLKEFVHIGVAVDTPRGLLVPVMRDVDRKPLFSVARELNELALRARDKKLTPDEMSGACFTVSNLGGLGTTYFSPIVNWPEVAILGLGRATVQPVHDGSSFQPRRMLPLSLSYDHRVIDGADAARFLRWLAQALEQPLLLLLDGSESGA